MRHFLQEPIDILVEDSWPLHAGTNHGIVVVHPRLLRNTVSSGWFARLRGLIARYRLARRTRAELETLDDRMLRDIGLQAHDVPRVAALLHHDAELWAWPGARTLPFVRVGPPRFRDRMRQ